MFVNLCRRGNKDNLPLNRFASLPRPATKYVCPPRFPKEKKSNLKYYNIMADPRVRRGNYAFDLGPKIPEEPFYPCFELVRKDPVCRLYIRTLKKCIPFEDKTKDPKTTTKDKVRSKSRSSSDGRPLIGMMTTESQTDTYYEILEDEIPRVANCTQTDVVSDLSYELLGRPIIRNVLEGEDVATEIIPGDLFYFDQEIANVVTNCVSAVVEQALVELMMEYELEALLAQQRAYEAKRNLELLRLQRLQKRQQGLVEDNARLIQQDREAMEKAREAGDNITTAMFAKNFLNDLLGSAMDVARKDEALDEEEGYDADPFMKWIRKRTEKAQRINMTSRNLLDDILRNTATNIEASYDPLVTSAYQEEDYEIQGEYEPQIPELQERPGEFEQQEELGAFDQYQYEE